jgi:molybdate transport system substrate-binding protein
VSTRAVHKAFAAGLAVLALAGCGGGPAGSSPPGGSARTLTVLAAASLKDAFTNLGKQFEADNPGAQVRFSFGGSSDLAQQIVQGSPADVFAAASQTTMDTVVKAGLNDGEPQVFATNTLQIAVPPANPKGITGLADLAKDGVVLVLCAQQVPCGDAAKKVAQAAGITLRPASEEPDVKSVLGKVTAGEADAGLVYVSDVRSAGGKVKGIDFPEAARAVNDYPISVVKNSQQADLARKFADLVRAEAGKKALRDAGLSAP